MKVCSVGGCGKPHRAHGLCDKHCSARQRRLRGVPERGLQPLCRVEGCGRKFSAKGLCKRHYYNLYTLWAERERHTGWSKEAFVLARQQQNNRCAVCDVTFHSDPLAATGCVADHDHETGVKRALLCRRCNTLEGHHRKIPLDEEEWGRRIKAYRARYA